MKLMSDQLASEWRPVTNRVPRTVRFALAGFIGLSCLLQPTVSFACVQQIMGAQQTASTLEVTALTMIKTAWQNKIKSFIPAITTLSYANTQNTDAENRAIATVPDLDAQRKTALALSETRVRDSAAFLPSPTTCVVATLQRRLEKTTANYHSSRDLFTKVATRQSLNAPGSGAEKGALQSMTTLMANRCGKYANPAALQLPPAVAAQCPGTADPKMVDLDVQPWRSIFSALDLPAVGNAAIHPRTQAALDTVRMLIEPVALDPVRGLALARPEGQTITVNRFKDLARMNLARGALEDMIAMRTASPVVNTTDTKKISRMARFVELIAGQDVTPAAVGGPMNSISAAQSSKNQQLQALYSRLYAQKAMLTEFLKYTEQLMAMEAAHLSMIVEETGARPLAASAGARGP